MQKVFKKKTEGNLILLIITTGKKLHKKSEKAKKEKKRNKMDVKIEINRRGSSSTPKKHKAETKHNLQQLSQLRNQSLSKWKAKTSETKSISSVKQKLGTSDLHYNTHNINTGLSDFQESKIQQKFLEDARKNLENLPISRLEMNYFEAVNGDLLNESSIKEIYTPHRIMSAQKCSDTYKDVITSLINENLLSYSKYYENYYDRSKL